MTALSWQVLLQLKAEDKGYLRGTSGGARLNKDFCGLCEAGLAPCVEEKCHHCHACEHFVLSHAKG